MKTEQDARQAVGVTTYAYFQALKHCLETKWEPRYKTSSPMFRKLVRDTRKRIANFEEVFGEIVYKQDTPSIGDKDAPTLGDSEFLA